MGWVIKRLRLLNWSTSQSRPFNDKPFWTPRHALAHLIIWSDNTVRWQRLITVCSMGPVVYVMQPRMHMVCNIPCEQLAYLKILYHWFETEIKIKKMENVLSKMERWNVRVPLVSISLMASAKVSQIFGKLTNSSYGEFLKEILMWLTNFHRYSDIDECKNANQCSSNEECYNYRLVRLNNGTTLDLIFFFHQSWIFISYHMLFPLV